MKNNKLLIALAIAACSCAVMANEEINYSFSLKSWNHNLKQPTTNSETVNAAVISATAKKGDYFITGSSLLPITYSFGSGSELFRRDIDLALGWSLNSNVSLLAGQKKIGVRSYNTSNGWNNWNINATYLGANGFTSLGEKSFAYGTYTQSIKGKSTDDNNSMKFTYYEGGLGYVLSKDTQLTVGYRNQKFVGNNGYTTTLPGIIFGVNVTP